ncbi:MAG: NAD(P)-dependent oxidoreductase [Devosia sp.]
MRIAITGARGRVGTVVTAEGLARGHDIVAIDVSPPDPVPHDRRRDIVADTTDYAALLASLAGCDALIHLAAIPHPLTDPDHVVHNRNVVSSYNALRGAIEVGITRLCQASSVNAIGLSFSRAPRFDYFPIDEAHPPYIEDPYALSKWICELQADSLVRRYDAIRIASLRLHLVTPSREAAQPSLAQNPAARARELFGYVRGDSVADACLKSLTAAFTGHEIFNIVAPDTVLDEPTLDVARRLYPGVEIRKPLPGTASFFDSSRAARLLGWVHSRG